MAQRSPHPLATDDKPAEAARDQQRNSNLARIRDNQRRSRARRKEYLEELEGRLRNCQQLGIEASAEIQAAARRVVDENKRLRQLLRRQGLSDAEIDGLTVGPPPETSPHNTSAGALEGMLSARKTCSCDDSPGSGQGCLLPNPSSLDRPPSSSTPPFVPIAPDDPYLTAAAAAAHPPPRSDPPARPLLPQPIPVSFQHLGTGTSSSLSSTSLHHHHPSTSALIPTSENLPPFPPLAPQHLHDHQQPFPTFHDAQDHGTTAFDLGYDEPTGWLMNYDPATPSAAAAAAAAAGGGGIQIPSSSASSPPSSPATAATNLLFSNTSSCVAAADLIRTIRPDIELAELERELGCADGGECKVPLTQVFSIMNRVAERGVLGG